jgi:hypothetical protein
MEAAMKNETRIPVEKYAVMKKRSIYQVLKMIKNEELKSVVEEKDGRKITYVVVGEETEDKAAEPAPEPQAPEAEPDDKTACETLRRELDALRRDFEALKEKIETGRVVL